MHHNPFGVALSLLFSRAGLKAGLHRSWRGALRRRCTGAMRLPELDLEVLHQVRRSSAITLAWLNCMCSVGVHCGYACGLCCVSSCNAAALSVLAAVR